MPTSAGTPDKFSNVACGHYQLLRERLLHHQRMSNIKTTIDKSPPATTKLKHFKQQVNKHHVENERKEDVRTENLRLYNRMLDIQEKGSAKTGGPTPQTVHRSTESKYSRSKNWTARRARHKAIDKKNKQLFRRLQGAKTQLPTKKALAKQYRKNRQHFRIARRSDELARPRMSKNQHLDRFGSSPRRTRAKPKVFCRELQEKLNPECIPRPRRPATSDGTRPGPEDRYAKPAVPSLAQGRLPREPKGIGKRKKKIRFKREKVKKYSAWPEERPPRLFDHPGISRKNDKL